MKKIVLFLLAAMTAVSAFAQLDGCKEILNIRITGVEDSSKIDVNESMGVGLKAFGGYCDNQYFKGKVLPGGFDNMKKIDGVATLSTRYVLEGTDKNGQVCKMFIENNALQGSSYSSPTVFTDSKALAFLNDSPLVGYLDKSNHEFRVRIFVREPKATVDTLWIQGSRGRLAATLEVPALKAGEKYPIVIICHGFGGNRDRGTTCMAAQQLTKEGIATLRFDFNGHGQSEGEMKDMTVLNEIEDAKCVYQYASSLPWVDTDRMAILGASQGGVVASMTAGELGCTKLAAAVLMCPAAVLRDDCIKGNTMGKQYNPLDPPERIDLGNGKVLGREFIKTTFNLPIYETAERFHGKACIIHGTGDRTAPYTYGIRYHQIWPGSEYHQLEGFDHGFNPNPQKAVDIAVNYLKRILH
jgi:alpha/beta superfamily hydrolase